MATRCCCPSGELRGHALLAVWDVEKVKELRDVAESGRDPSKRTGELDVVARGEERDEVVKLVDEADGMLRR